MKLLAVSDLNVELSTIFDEEFANFAKTWGHEAASLKLKTFPERYNSLYKQRKTVMPKLPTSRATIDLQGEYTETVDGLPFKISLAELQGQCIVYASPNGLKLMSKCKVWGGDGTYLLDHQNQQ